MKYPPVDGPRCKKCHGYGVVRVLWRVQGGGLTTKIAGCDRCYGSKTEQTNKKRGRK